MARTSRRFQVLVTPTLYHTVVFDMDWMEERRSDSSPLLAFVERMLAAPDRLAALVRDFWINGTPEMDDLRPVVAMRRSPHETSIEALDRFYPGRFEVRGFDEHPPSPDAIAFFAQWPSVKRIYSAGYINRDAGNQLETAFRPLRPSSLPLESLVLGPHTQLSHPHLDELLSAPRAMRVFRYNPMYRTETKFRTAILQRSLERQKHALEEVSLVHGYYKWHHANGRVYDEEHNLYGDMLGSMSFAAFDKLRVLEIVLPFVFGQAVVCFGRGTPPRRNRDVANPSPAQQRACETRLLEMLPLSIETVRFAQCGDRWAARLLGGALVPLVDEVRVGAFVL
ncbi:hypothetical protein PG996_013653 [Apiospora saccharicola]|uniref:Uncharacterized protein n=1 Tax=Apiospora saccharicola TaxID=335842 RepID=A0ABR1U6K4_9PEZI